jgi:hypothetical protein
VKQGRLAKALGVVAVVVLLALWVPVWIRDGFFSRQSLHDPYVWLGVAFGIVASIGLAYFLCALRRPVVPTPEDERRGSAKSRT